VSARVADAASLYEGGLTRAEALKLGALGLAFAAVPLLQYAAADDAPPFLRRSTFEPLVGSPFTLTSPDGAALRVRLSDVEDTAAARRGAPRERSFSLLFRGESRRDAVQGTYGVAHRDLRPFALFIVPVERGVRGQSYQAIVNRTLA